MSAPPSMAKPTTCCSLRLCRMEPRLGPTAAWANLFSHRSKGVAVLHLCHPLGFPGMTSCPLRQNENEHDHKHRDDRGGNWTAQGEPTMI